MCIRDRPYIRRRAVRHLEKGRVVILAAGTGNPYSVSYTHLQASEAAAPFVVSMTEPPPMAANPSQPRSA